MSAGNVKWIQSPYLATGNPNTEQMTTLYAPGMLGCAMSFDQGPWYIGDGVSQIPCEYQLVKQATDFGALDGGLIARWVDKRNWTVDLSQAATSGNLAGVSQLQTAEKVLTGADDNTYIWILKKGEAQVFFVDPPVVDPSTAAGLPVVASDATDGRADCLADSATQAAFPLIGTSMGVVAIDVDTYWVNVNIPDRY